MPIGKSLPLLRISILLPGKRSAGSKTRIYMVIDVEIPLIGAAVTPCGRETERASWWTLVVRALERCGPAGGASFPGCSIKLKWWAQAVSTENFMKFLARLCVIHL